MLRVLLRRLPGRRQSLRGAAIHRRPMHAPRAQVKTAPIRVAPNKPRVIRTRARLLRAMRSSTSARPARPTALPRRDHPATHASTKTRANAAVAAATVGKTAKEKARPPRMEAPRTAEADHVRGETPVTSVPHAANTRPAPRAAKMTAATVAIAASLLFPRAPRNQVAGSSKSRPRDLAICGKSPAITSRIRRIFLCRQRWCATAACAMEFSSRGKSVLASGAPR